VGTIVACIFVAIVVAALSAWLPAAKAKARRAASVANLHSWGSAIQMYVHTKGGYPPDLQTLIDVRYVESCPSLLDPVDRAAGGAAAESSYAYVGIIPTDTPERTIIAYTRRGMVPGERLVLWNDQGRNVDWLPEADLHAPGGQTSLAASYKAVVAAFGEALTPERDAELKTFYEVRD
jgi:hypothetical protein